MLQRINDAFRRFMYGRYGTDQLNMVLLVAAIICSLLFRIKNSLTFLYLLSNFLLIYAVFRSFSKNIAARQKEASAYNRAKKFFTDRQHRYYDCPGCGQTVRVPRGKGKINIRCPRCGEHFEKKT